MSDRQTTFPQFTSNSILVKRGINRPNCLGLLNLSNSFANGKVIWFLVFNSPWDTPDTEKTYLWEVFTCGKWQSEGLTVYSTMYVQKWVRRLPPRNGFSFSPFLFTNKVYKSLQWSWTFILSKCPIFNTDGGEKQSVS